MPDPDPVLDADIIDALNLGLAPIAADGAASQRIKSRLMQRVAHLAQAEAQTEAPRHRTVQPHEGAWRDLGDGLSLKVLHRAGDAMSYLLRLAPGARLPAHRHPMDEECVVLEGAVQIGTLRLGPGGFHLGAQGVPHDVIECPEGALLFLRGAVPGEALNL